MNYELRVTNYELRVTNFQVLANKERAHVYDVDKMAQFSDRMASLSLFFKTVKLSYFVIQKRGKSYFIRIFAL